MLSIDIPYFPDSWKYISLLADASGLIWYHEGHDSNQNEWISAWPSHLYEYQGQQMTRTTDANSTVKLVKGDFFNLLRTNQPHLEASNGIKFTGGLAGHLSYDFGLELLDIPSRQPNPALPLAVVGQYDWALCLDHSKQQALLTIQSHCPTSIREQVEQTFFQINESNKSYGQSTDVEFGPWHCLLSKQQYSDAFKRLKHYIVEGDTYQVNLTRQWQSNVGNGSDLSIYQKLFDVMPAPFSVFHRNQSHTLLSVSPERFIQIDNGKILTQPIKGTRPRSSDSHLDAQLKNELVHSEKDRAENLMIVDLLRNDLAKNSVPGSVKVDRLFEVQSFKNVHHLVSTVSAELSENKDPLHVLEDAFPGGSITGAPKKRAMEIIEELESTNRGNYCGCSFYLGANDTFDSNILIRSLTLKDNILTCSGGGGIVYDSQLDEEYEESDVKVRRLLSALSSQIQER